MVPPMIDLKSALDDVRHELATAREQQQSLIAHIESLEAEAHGLELAVARHNGHGAEAAVVRSEVSNWRKMSRTDAILQILEESSQPLGPAEITAALHAQGRNDRRDPVAAALAYLKTKNRVHHVDYGKWTTKNRAVGSPGVIEGGGPP